MILHFAATTATACYLAYHGPRGPVAVMECASEAIAQREANRRNEFARAAALAARLVIRDIHPLNFTRRVRERMYGPEFGDGDPGEFAD